MTRNRLSAHIACTFLTLIFAASLVFGPALAQERSSGGFLDSLFGRGQEVQQPEARQPPAQPRVAQADPSDLSVRVDRVESALRQLTGTIEELQHQNQMLQMQLKRMQDDTEYRFQQLGARGAPAVAPVAPTGGAAPPAASPQRSDVFDPSRNPNAPGAPRTLGNASAVAPPQAAANQPSAGAPLDLSTLAGSAPGGPPPRNPPVMAPPQVTQLPPQTSQLPPPQPRNTGVAGAQIATLPPSASPKDEYQLAYGYVLHKDYALAEQAFKDFLKKYPNESLLPEAQYWLGESLFQQQRYRDAAESFLAVSTKYERSGKAPEALLRLGESLAALHQKEAACATFAEIGRKFPRASSGVKKGVVREQKRAQC